MLLSFRAKTVPPILSVPQLCFVEPKAFVSGFWSPKGDEFVAQFKNGMTFAMKAEDARKLFVLLNGSETPELSPAPAVPAA